MNKWIIENWKYWSALLSVVAILISVLSLWSQIRTQRRQDKRDLYEKRFGILQTIINSASRHSLALADNTSPEQSDLNTPRGRWQATLRISGALSDAEMKELLLAVQHIHYLYDDETSELASKLYKELGVTQELAYKRARATASQSYPADLLDGVKENHDAVMKTTNELVARLTKELYLR